MVNGTEIVEAFSTFIQKRVLDRSSRFQEIGEWSLPLNQLIQSFDKGPIQALYKTINLGLFPNCKFNENRYAETKFKIIENKVRSISSGSNSLKIEQKNSKQILLGLTVHRLIARKDMSNILRNYGQAVSYHDIPLQNEHLNKTLSTTGCIYNVLEMSTSTYSILDDNNFRTEAQTENGTAHHTNQIFFQPGYSGI